MVNKRKKAQGLVEYLMLIGLVAAVAVPLVKPMYNQGNIQKTSPIKNEISSEKLTQAKHVQTQTNQTTSNSSTITSSNNEHPDWEETPAKFQQVYVFASIDGCWNGYAEGTMKSFFSDQASQYLNNITYGGIFDKLTGQAKTVAANYCNTSYTKSEAKENGAYNASTYVNKVVIFNADGTLHGVYDIDSILNANPSYSTDPASNPLARDSSYHEDHSTLKDTIMTLPGGEKVGVIDNAWYSPLVFDLDKNGIHTVEKTIMYDINGDGKKELINDIDPKDGILIIKQGKSGLELFGDNSDFNNDGKPDGFKNGYEALKSLARKDRLINDKNDMKLNSKDLSLLEKKYILGMKTGGYYGKIHTLKSLGITEITLGKSKNARLKNYFDERGNILMIQDGASFKIHNSTNIFVDVWHKVVNTLKNLIKNMQYI